MSSRRSKPKGKHIPMPDGGEGREYLIWSIGHNRGWHRRDHEGRAAGYTSDIERAGVFERETASTYHDTEPFGRDNIAIHITAKAHDLHRAADRLEGEAMAARALAQRVAAMIEAKP